MTPPLDRSRPPTAGPVRPFRFPHFDHRSLDGGLELYCALSDETPLLHLELLTRSGALFDRPGRRGLASLTAAVLDEGTERRTSQEIAGTAEALGGYIAATADWDVISISTSLLAAHWREGIELVADVAVRPVFPERELERLRQQTLAELASRRKRPASIAQRALAAGLYGESPYGGFLLGEEESVGAISRSDLIGHFRDRVAANQAVLIATGDADPEALVAAIEEELGGAFGGRRAPLPPITPPPRSGRQVLLVDRPGAAQTELRVGHVGLPRGHPDSTTAHVLNALLGGKFTSRLNLNLRERHGYTYGVHSRFSKRLGPGPFSVSAAVGNDVAGDAAREILSELQRLRAEPVPEDELEETRSYLLGVFPYTVQTLDGIAARLEDLAVYDLPLDYFHELPGRIRAITSAELLEVARRHLDPEGALVVAVGPAEALHDGLAELGEVTVQQP